MSSRKVLGIIWAAVLVGIFTLTMEIGSAPTEMEALGLLFSFLFFGGIWSFLIGMVTFFFTKGDQR